jgi:hypothetical protein
MRAIVIASEDGSLLALATHVTASNPAERAMLDAIEQVDPAVSPLSLWWNRVRRPATET